MPSLKSLIPEDLKMHWRRWRGRREQAANRSRSAEDVFTDIYVRNRWGGATGEFCSGSGSADSAITDPYVATIERLSATLGFRNTGFVDLGCGDFRVGERLAPMAAWYVGVDVVRPLVERNQKLFGNDKVRFVHLDIAGAQLPQGQVCFVRQVLQHLSNAQISRVLDRLRRYEWVFVTEHQPTTSDRVLPNKDKVHGGCVRLADNSGVYLTRPPFCIPEQEVQLVLEVAGTDLGPGIDRGVIRTFLYTPGREHLPR